MRVVRFASLLAGAALLATALPALAQPRVREVDLVADLSGHALNTDPNLVNPWGIVPGPTGVFWASDNGTGKSTLYAPDGTPRTLVVTIPGGKPTGVVLASSQDSAFAIPSGDTTARAIFIFATENGTIAAWSPRVDSLNAIQVASTDGAIYKGLAIGHTAEGLRLYAANFHAGRIDVFDRHFAPVSPAGSFTDPNLPSGYGPFNVAVIHNEVLVSFAQQDANQEDDVPGPGLGFVDVFDVHGAFVRRLISQGPLDAPWGMVRPPSGWLGLPEALLVGNFGDGHINVFDPASGAFLGSLADTLGNQLTIEGLWGLSFGAPAGTPQAQRLYFAAGPGEEAHGLFGFLAPRETTVVVAGPCGGGDRRGPGGLAFWSAACGFGPPEHSQAWNHGWRGRGPSSDSLKALLDCVTAASHGFGSDGCLHANCDLLAKRGHRTAREFAGQQLLALMLNRCSGRICDSTSLHCGDEGDDESGDDDHGGGSTIATVGDLIERLDGALCSASDTTLRHLASLAACANNLEGEGGDEGDDDGRISGTMLRTPIGLLAQALNNPGRLSGFGMRFVVSTATPAKVGMRIYDAAGRLVAEPVRGAAVSSQLLVQWDGRDLRGVRVVPGTYFFRAVSGRDVSSGRFVMIH